MITKIVFRLHAVCIAIYFVPSMTYRFYHRPDIRGYVWSLWLEAEENYRCNPKNHNLQTQDSKFIVYCKFSEGDLCNFIVFPDCLGLKRAKSPIHII